MSYANLVKKLDARGKIRLRGGQCGGRVETNEETLPVNERYIPSKGKGSEYAVKYRAEDERAFTEMLERSGTQGLARIDVTGGESSQVEQLEELTSIGTVPNLRELNREELTQVYSRYNFEPVEPTEHLETIFNQRERILQLIATNQVCIIKGKTGCGKSTQIPQFILDSHAAEKKHCNIVVTQPRRIAAISIAQRVCRERNWGDPGGIVGYQVGLDKKADEDTRILYCTTGVLLEKLINAKHMNDYTHVILDEVHEREEDMDFLMLVVRKFLRSNSPHVKVVLMSATIDVSRFAKYFGVPVRNMISPAVTYTIETESKFTVQTHYLEVLGQIGRLPDEYREDNPMIAKEAYELVPVMIRCFNSIDIDDYKNRRSSEKKSAVLIFLPGLHQIEYLHELLLKEDEMQKKNQQNPNFLNLWLCPLHSSITKDEQEKVTAYAPEGYRKVILSTNIAESSLTIPDVKYVIDFCLTKHLVADPNTGFTSLQLAWASHVNCIQREGRVGRVQDGRVYRMVKKEFYQFHMEKESVPEMLRCPLDLVVLKCKRLMEDECPLRLISSALDPPDLDNYEKTILKLKEIGALLMTCRGENDPNDGDLTFMGRVMGSLPLDIRITKLILLGHLFDILQETIIMGCAMSVRNIFSEPFQQRLDAYNNKLLWADASESDSIAYLNAYTVWREMTALGKFQRSKASEPAWGRCFMLQIRHLKEVALLEADIKKRLRHFNIEISHSKNKPMWNNQEKPTILKIALAGAFYPNYYTCSSTSTNAEVEAVKVLNSHSPFHCVYLQNMAHPAPLYFDQVKEFLRVNGVSDNIELYYDSSQKLVVEFQRTKTMEKTDVGNKQMRGYVPGEILMPVYRAVKMRQLGISPTIVLFPKEMVIEKLKTLFLNSKCSKMNLRTQSTDYMPLIPWDQQIVEISVCHVEDAGTFYGQIHPTTIEKLKLLHSLLNQRNLLNELSGEVEIDAVYAAPFQDTGDLVPCYYRAKVLKKECSLRTKNIPHVDVFFVDYGNSASIPEHELREIVDEEAQNEIEKIPPLAVKFVLAKVAACTWEGQWTEEANRYVRHILIEQRNTWTTQIYSFVNGVASVYLYLQEEGRGGKLPLTLNSVLIQKGYARSKEENYLSKKNHQKREEMAKVEQQMDSNFIDSKAFESSNDILKLEISDDRKKTRILKGPHSPLEMKLYSKIRSSVQKEVRVEWNSVNSVLLDAEPNEPYEKLLVAGFVSQSSDGRKLLLNHTSVLPNWDGLAALVCLIFSPSVELRSDECRSRYIGALCGLGSDSDGRPIFPENDMEIKFDMEIKNDDLLMVNKIRYFMNRRFCCEDSEDMTEHQIFNLQHHIKDLFTKLLSTLRQPMKVEYFRRQFKWNQVPEKYLLAPYEESEDKSLRTSIFHLFPGIDLDPKNDFEYIQDLVKKFNRLMGFVHKDLAPKDIVCDLCDVDFQYWPMLREHVGSSHHEKMKCWLQRRASAHGLTLDLAKPQPPAPVAAQPTARQPHRQPGSQHTTSHGRQPTVRPKPSTSQS